ncbi:OmpA family protein [Ahrensia sp. 13_GOM-1096m]|uniref:OmpA family protein n=1 Tax=Ahrensia sp. 13_GOM-1096m TaxID=1380380 RepID=UPI0012DC4583|nr:OmpA family protein [Ahrensia sp. 13_GOM-1096m]
MATTALMIAFQPAMASMSVPSGSEMSFKVAQGAEAAQVLNDALAALSEASAALAAANASGEGVEAAEQAVDAAQARVNQAQADFEAAKAAQAPEPEAPAEPAAEPEAAPEPAPEPKVEAPVQETAPVEEPAPEVEIQTPEPKAEAPVAQEPEAEPKVEEPAKEAAPEPAPEAPVAQEPEAEPAAEAPAKEAAPEPAKEAAPKEDAMKEPAPKAEATEEKPAAENTEKPAADNQATEQPTQVEPAAKASAEEKPADKKPADVEVVDEAEISIEVKEPEVVVKPVEVIIEETKGAPVTVLPEKVSEQERAALDKAEKERRDDARKRRNELLGAAAVGVAVGVLVPMLGGKLVEDQGDRVIIERNGEYFVRKDENALLRRDDVDVYYEDLDNGLSRETMTRPNGVQIITTRAPNGDILRRERVRRDGSVVVLIDSLDRGRVDYVDYDRELPPINLTIDRGLYVVDARNANQARLRETFFAPPVEKVRQAYTLREVRSSERLRDTMRSVDLDNIQFDTGSATVRQSQVILLEKAALAIADVINKNPSAVFLIEGHTDAVGGEVYNLALSDRRAETVARILTMNYGLPPENFVVEGYGEAHLKINTQRDEPRNRRVAIRNITPLLGASK